MRLIPVLALAFALASGQALAAPPSKAASNQGVFTSVQGKVQIKKTGKQNKTVKKDSTVKEGERVVTGKDSTATLRFFDGSELKISPKTDFRLSRLEKLPQQDKAMRFKLLAGKLWAKVQKLASRKSTFEIDAGGVVCGVRGTEFSVDYNPDNEHVDLHVDNGTVYTDVSGQVHNYHGGEDAHFNHGDSGEHGHGGDHEGEHGHGNDPKGNPALDDQVGELTHGGISNDDNTSTDPGVKDTVKMKVRINVSPAETVP